ncbi:MAG: hypothetical protein WAS07_01320 [Micropruina sp.]|nr:hypothetical protein [Micropruina sp.]
MNKTRVALIAGYIAAVTWLGYLAADPAMREAFTGSSAYTLIAFLGALYAGVTLATVWFVAFLNRFSFKLAANDLYQPDVAKSAIHSLLVVALFSRLPGLLGQEFWHTNIGVAALLIPLALAVRAAWREPSLTGARKALAYLPIFVYLVADAGVLLSMGQG